LSDPTGQAARMKHNTCGANLNCNKPHNPETWWQTVVGCALFWAGLLTLWWVL